MLVVNHRQPLDVPALPISRVAARARSEGALLDLEKHNWPWSLALVPLVKPDLFELANNHHWRVAYSITNWAEPAPAWMNLGTGGGSEREWTLSGFQTYYALLNSGFRLSPAAGCAPARQTYRAAGSGSGDCGTFAKRPGSYPCTASRSSSVS